jgi:hypothetical protein
MGLVGGHKPYPLRIYRYAKQGLEALIDKFVQGFRGVNCRRPAQSRERSIQLLPLSQDVPEAGRRNP